jgi:hypothetical protein
MSESDPKLPSISNGDGSEASSREAHRRTMRGLEIRGPWADDPIWRDIKDKALPVMDLKAVTAPLLSSRTRIRYPLDRQGTPRATPVVSKRR